MAIFFGFNLLSNAIMWILFTRALTAATSTTQVSILNTSCNFMVTALLGWLVFSETLPVGWWAGAALLVAGSVVIGAREGGDAEQSKEATGAVALETSRHSPRSDPRDEQISEDSNQHNRYTDEEEEDQVEESPRHTSIKR
ncbi:MAG: hypothetical protein M1831_006624 [Alyxoria varia]|nr:MAG: hypothetical protein M1831_006624 [Alyxoria varia]